MELSFGYDIPLRNDLVYLVYIVKEINCQYLYIKKFKNACIFISKAQQVCNNITRLPICHILNTAEE